MGCAASTETVPAANSLGDRHDCSELREAFGDLIVKARRADLTADQRSRLVDFLYGMQKVPTHDMLAV